MVKNALAVGLLAAGCNVLDLGKLVTPIGRYGVRNLGTNGGLHVNSMDQGERVCITFFDHQGANITKGEERKIENAFFREDFRRVTGSQVTHLNYYPDIVDIYYEDLIKSVNMEAIKNAGLKIFLEYDLSNFGEHLPRMLEHLGCQVYISERACMAHNRQNDFSWHKEQVLKYRCDLGVIMHSDGEYLILIDSNGTVIQEDLYTALVSLMVLKTSAPSTIVIPVTAPQVIETMAKKYRGKVVRTKTSKQFYMQQILEDKVLNSQKGYKQFNMEFDAINALVNIVEYLAREKTPLAQLIGAVPEFYLSRRDIECPWDAKGTVMRKLIEEQKRKAELLDGVKVYHDQGWALILPDSDEPVCRIFSEGTSMEAAEELTAMYADKVNNFKKE